jgi:hypothetical protein
VGISPSLAKMLVWIGDHKSVAELGSEKARRKRIACPLELLEECLDNVTGLSHRHVPILC